MQGDDLEYIDIADDCISYYVRCEHLARYIYASEQFRKRKVNYVLDIACGSGYGSVQIAKHVKTVVSVDKTTPMPIYQKSNINYIQCDINNDDFISSIYLKNKFDAMACFETLEHLNDTYSFLQSLSSIIKNRGLLFISVPNSEYEKTTKTGESNNAFHLHTFRAHDVEKLLLDSGFVILRRLFQPTSSTLYRNQVRTRRDLNLSQDYIKKMSPSTKDMDYYCRLYAWPDENKGQSYSMIYMCERKY